MAAMAKTAADVKAMILKAGPPSDPTLFQIEVDVVAQPIAHC